MATLYLLQYNNYFNRTIKKYNTIQEYLNNETLVNYIQNATLFNPNDGVNATLTTPLQTYGGIDYVVATKDNIIISRWFVIEATRLQGGQYRLSLKRDVIADNFDEIIYNADCYIERGWCDVSNSAIYNSEPLTFNQIKKSQTELYDKSFTPWIVGYMSFNKATTMEPIEFRFYGELYTVNINYETVISINRERAPYFMFCMPYDAFRWTSPTAISQPKGLASSCAQALSGAFSGSGVLLDIQLLPYCPDKSLLTGAAMGQCGSHYVGIINKTTNAAEGYINFFSNPDVQGYIATKDTSTQGYTDFTYYIGNIKLESQTNMARIVSPNGNGVWEFIPAKEVDANNTSNKIQYNMTCMPYQPYIKIEPQFGRLYGGNYNDTRGLICGGDFSLPQISNQWNSYQIQNKNYQNMFNRQIDSLDLQQKYEKKQDISNMITGTLQGAVGGGMAGTSTKMQGAAIAGMVIGAGASLAGGIMDLQANQALRADKRSATVDMHNMSLQNIQALPASVSKASNFNIEQPKVPYLEIYSCTADEKENFEKYLALYSYSINRVGNIKDYLQNNKRTFIRATLIRDEGIKDDSHLLADISQELSQGIYVGG